MRRNDFINSSFTKSGHEPSNVTKTGTLHSNANVTECGKPCQIVLKIEGWFLMQGRYLVSIPIETITRATVEQSRSYGIVVASYSFVLGRKARDAPLPMLHAKLLERRTGDGADAWHLAASRRPLALLLTSSWLRLGAHLVPESAVVIELDLGYGHGLAVPARCQRHLLRRPLTQLELGPRGSELSARVPRAGEGGHVGDFLGLQHLQVRVKASGGGEVPRGDMRGAGRRGRGARRISHIHFGPVDGRPAW